MTPSASLGLPSSLSSSIVTSSSTSSSRGTVSLSRVVFSFVLALNCLGVLAQPATPSSQQSLRLLSSEGPEWLHAFTTDRVEADMTNATNATSAIETMASFITPDYVMALTTAFNATNGTAAIETVSSITRYFTALLTSGVGTPAPYVATPALAASASVVANVLNGTSAIETMASFTQEVAQALTTAFNATTPVPLVSEGDRVAGYYNEMIGLAVALALVSIALIGLVVFILRTPHHGALPNLAANPADPPPANPADPPAIEMQAAPNPQVLNPGPYMVGQHLAQVEAQVVVGREQNGLNEITHTTTYATTYV